ncbi:MAG: hypothetical protein WAN56_07755, partial [Halobacteriota archaeon]
KKRLFGKMISRTTVYSSSFAVDLIQQQQLGSLVGYSPMLYKSIINVLRQRVINIATGIRRRS